MTQTVHLLEELSPASRSRLLGQAIDVRFSRGAQIFHEGHPADSFWVVSGGSVRLDLNVPARPPVVVETLHRGDLLGWSWFLPPYEWHLSAHAVGPVTALQFDAARVRDLCNADAALGYELSWHIARIIGHRLQQARMRLLDMYGPYGLASASEET